MDNTQRSYLVETAKWQKVIVILVVVFAIVAVVSIA